MVRGDHRPALTFSGRCMPVTGITEVVTEMWRASLDLSEAGPDDDFFELGGNSLLAVELAENLELRLGIAFPIEVLFYSGRLADVIAACQEAPPRAAGSADALQAGTES